MAAAAAPTTTTMTSHSIIVAVVATTTSSTAAKAAGGRSCRGPRRRRHPRHHDCHLAQLLATHVVAKWSRAVLYGQPFVGQTYNPSWPLIQMYRDMCTNSASAHVCLKDQAVPGRLATWTGWPASPDKLHRRG